MDLRLSSLDITAYAYLKEELVNTEDSAEVKYLKEKCPNLMRFYSLMEFLFTGASPTKSIAKETLTDARARLLSCNVAKMIGKGERSGSFDFSLHVQQTIN